MIGSLGADTANMNSASSSGKKSESGESVDGLSFDQTLEETEQNSEGTPVFDSPHDLDEEQLRVLALEENSDYVLGQHELVPLAEEEISVLNGADRSLTEKPKEIDVEALSGQLVNPMTDAEAEELARLKLIANSKLTGVEPEPEEFAIDRGKLFQDFTDGMNLEEGNAYRKQMDQEFVENPDLQAVAQDQSIAVASYGSVHASDINDPEAPPFVNQVSTNPESGKEDLDIAMMKEKQHMMSQSEFQPPKPLEVDDPRDQVITDPKRIPISVEEQIEMARAKRLEGETQEFDTQRLNDPRGKVEPFVPPKPLSTQEKLQQVMALQHNQQTAKQTDEIFNLNDSITAQRMMATLAMTAEEQQQQNLSIELQNSMQMLSDAPREMFQASGPIPRNTPLPKAEFRTVDDKIKVDVGSTPQNMLSSVMNNSSGKNAAVEATTGMAAAQEMLAESPFDISQLTRSMRSGRDQSTQEITLQLNPEELGRLVMKVRQEGDQLQVKMQVENPQVKQLIEANFNELRERFLDKDFAFKEMSLNVDIDQRSASEFDGHPYQGRFQGDYVAERQEDRLAAKESEITKPIVRRGSDSGLNLYV